MKNTLIELWRGNIAPCDQKSIHSKETKELASLLERNHSKLCETLNDREKEILQKWEDEHDELLLLSCEDAFIKGFSLAIQLVTDALVDQ